MYTLIIITYIRKVLGNSRLDAQLRGMLLPPYAVMVVQQEAGYR
jgi:hypothetical protein